MLLTLAVRVAELVTKCGKVIHNGLTISENALGYFFRVLSWCEIQTLGSCGVKLWKVVIFTVALSCVVDDMLANRFQ